MLETVKKLWVLEITKKENRNDNDDHRFHLREPTFANGMGEISG